MSEDEDFSDYESGPFCRHWDDYSCPITCKNCGHRCTEHDFEDGDCMESGCQCKKWEEKEQP